LDAGEFSALGGFDESFFLLYEDRDLSRRYLAGGGVLRTCRGIAVAHEIGTSSSAEGLDVRRRCWAALSWIELRSAEAGKAAGRATAKRIATALRFEAAVGRVLGNVGASGTRLARKLADAGEVERCMRAGGGVQGSGFYARARAALGVNDDRSDDA